MNGREVDMNEVEEAALDIAKVRQHFVKMTTHADRRLQLGIEFVISSSKATSNKWQGVSSHTKSAANEKPCFNG